MNATTNPSWSILLDPAFSIIEIAYLMDALDCRLDLLGDQVVMVPIRTTQLPPDTHRLIELLTHPRAPAVRPLRESLRLVSILGQRGVQP